MASLSTTSPAHRKTRFPFSYAWWGGFNWKAKAKDNIDICKTQHNWAQGEKYKLCGLKIKRDLLDGNAVVVFAYGLSGSGKTFTVFGCDAADNPGSWFHQEDKNTKGAAMWGIFPNLGYEASTLWPQRTLRCIFLPSSGR